MPCSEEVFQAAISCHLNNTFKIILQAQSLRVSYSLGIIFLHLLKKIRAWQGMGLILCCAALIQKCRACGNVVIKAFLCRKSTPIPHPSIHPGTWLLIKGIIAQEEKMTVLTKKLSRATRTWERKREIISLISVSWAQHTVPGLNSAPISPAKHSWIKHTEDLHNQHSSSNSFIA